jgi:hypothetical protein
MLGRIWRRLAVAKVPQTLEFVEGAIDQREKIILYSCFRQATRRLRDKLGDLQSDGSVVADGGANPVSGYTLIEADSYVDALEKAKGCPVLASGGSVEVAETMDM